MRRPAISPAFIQLEDRSVPNSLGEFFGVSLLNPSLLSLGNRPSSRLAVAQEAPAPGLGWSHGTYLVSGIATSVVRDLLRASDASKSSIAQPDIQVHSPQSLQSSFVGKSVAQSVTFAEPDSLGGLPLDGNLGAIDLSKPGVRASSIPRSIVDCSDTRPSAMGSAQTEATLSLPRTDLSPIPARDRPTATGPTQSGAQNNSLLTVVASQTLLPANEGGSGSVQGEPCPTLIVDGGNDVPINGDNDNGSSWVAEGIPAVRDYSTAPIPSEDDLVSVQMSGLPLGFKGVLTVSAYNFTDGSAAIRLWETPTKTQEIGSDPYDADSFPNPFYVEGIEFSDTESDVVTITVELLSNDTLCIAEVEVPVSPIKQSFSVTPANAPNIGWFNQIDGLSGLVAARVINPIAQGATFGAVWDVGQAKGEPILIQNVMNITNGLMSGRGAGYIHTAGSGLPSMNLLPKFGNSFPFLDSQAGNPAPPAYNVNWSSSRTGNAFTISATDSPRSSGPNAQWMDRLDLIDVVEYFRLYLVWKFPDGSLLSMHSIDWEVVFWADTNVAGSGVSVIRRPNGITARPWARSTEQPKTGQPFANQGLEIR